MTLKSTLFSPFSAFTSTYLNLLLTPVVLDGLSDRGKFYASRLILVGSIICSDDE